MGDFSRDEDFVRERDRQYLLSVCAAAAAAYDRAAYSPLGEARAVLAAELERRGIEPEPGAVLAGATLISRGELPPILRPGTGKRRRPEVNCVPSVSASRPFQASSEAGVAPQWG
jgi:hypothetical protein